MAVTKDTKKKETKPGVKLADVTFYFDSVERDRFDCAGWTRRSSEVLHLREKLLKLRAEDFEAAIKTMKNVIRDGKREDDDADGAEGSKAKRQAAMKLFEQVQSSGR